MSQCFSVCCDTAELVQPLPFPQSKARTYLGPQRNRAGGNGPNVLIALASASYSQFSPGKDVWSCNPVWSDYIACARDALRECPSSKAVTGRDMITPSLSKGCADGQCSAFGLFEFSTCLGQEVEKRVRNVSEIICFSFSILVTSELKVPLELPFWKSVA